MRPPRLGRYVIESELGRGAMGVVYRARDDVLDRTVAVKTVNVALARDDAERYEARFLQEARAAGSLSHPNIVTVYDAGRSGELAFMAMELVDGAELRALIADGQPLPLSQALGIAAQVADGLAYAHARGIVHRDVKPANIMVPAGGPVKITDFGIARMRASTELTQSGLVVGSPRYMSPEQVLGRRADARSDLFSLGVVLYEMLTGTAPFAGDSATALMYQIVHVAPPAPSGRNPAVPPLVDAVVARLLAKAPEDRYASADALAAELRQCAQRVAAAGGAPVAQPFPVGMASGSHPRLVEAPAPPPPSLTRACDLAQAEPQTATQAVRALVEAQPERKRWRRRDWLLVGGAGAAGLLLARLVLRKGR